MEFVVINAFDNTLPDDVVSLQLVSARNTGLEKETKTLVFGYIPMIGGITKVGWWDISTSKPEFKERATNNEIDYISERAKKCNF